MIGSSIGSYRITKLLGEGGMGAVYLATDNIERQVAIKALRPQLTHDDSRLARFRSEAVALGRLNHPNIAALYHLLEENEHFYMVMEYVEGQTLEELITRSGALPVRLALDVFIDGLHGFEHAHSRGVIHRDIKASNLMVSNEGSTKIMDFGIARLDGGQRMTKTGQQMGTLEYMSPEQVRGQEQDARSDIYSLGVLLYELLTGRVPFTDASDFELMRAHLEKTPTSVRHFLETLPAALDEIIAKALAKEPDERFQNIAEMREALEAIASAIPDSEAAPAPVATPTPAKTVTPVVSRSKYETMLIDTDPATEQPIERPTAVPAPVKSSVSRPVNRPNQWMITSGIVAGILAASALAFSLFKRPAAKTASAPPQTTIAQPKPVVKRAKVASKPPSNTRTTERSTTRKRRNTERTRTAEQPTTRRRVVREVSQSRPAPSAPRSRPSSGGDERAALRAIIKGN